MTIETSKIPPQMSGSMIKLLCALRDAELEGRTPTLTELAKDLGITTAAMTGQVDTATARGHVTARHSAHDRRTKFLELTRDGLALVDGMRPKQSEAVCGICGMTPSDVSDKSDGSDGSDLSDASEGKEAA